MSGYRYAMGDRPLDGYTIEYGLGRGGFGEVYFAKSDSGREVALKVIQNHEDIELRGVSHCMNLKSPHLVTIFDVKRGATGVPWVIMEYVSGPSLREILDDANTPDGIGEDQALYFTRELIKGMRYLHDAGVVHRDLKPHNIFFEDGTVKIGDYSLSKAISTSHRNGHTTTVGSVHYMAPEIGEGNYDKAVDIYALGVILYEMLTGQPPYVGESMGEVLIKHLSQQPDVSGLKEPFASTILKAMQRDPANRFQTVDQMLHSLCPTDHSSYLPAPASLSMIGERAVGRRARIDSASRVVEEGGEVLPKISDTSIPYAALVDTKESSDSQPFERPGLPKANGEFLKGLSRAGLWWCPSNLTHQGTDSASLPVRIFCAVLASFAIMLPTAVVTSAASAPKGAFWGEVVLFATLTLPVLGGLLSWLFRQVLPRSRFIFWTVVSRVMTTAIVMGLGCFYMALFCEAFNLRFDPDLSAGLFAIGLLVEWRSFISAERYPRVGLLKSICPAAIFTCFLIIIGERLNGDLILAAAIVSVVAINIQLLAPYYQIPQVKMLEPSQTRASRRPKRSDALNETSLDSESFILQENV